MIVLVVSKSLCGYVSNQVQYNMESAQYLLELYTYTQSHTNEIQMVFVCTLSHFQFHSIFLTA